MTTHKYRRLLMPAVAVAGGAALAVAEAIHRSSKVGLFVGLIALLYAALLFGAGHDDSDLGALIGNRADERQKVIHWRAAKVALGSTIAAVLALAVIAAATDNVIWPYEVLTVVTTIAYFVGLHICGADRPPLPEQADGAALETPTGSVASRTD